jgi:Pyridoxamine 5'-phosphate oxidase
VSRAVAPGPEGARAIIDDGRYMTLATADAAGMPWASPVWYAPRGYSELFWISYPDARHSRNLAERPQLSIVIFDSTVTPRHGQAVYMEAEAAQAADGVEVFSARSVAQGLGEWKDLSGPLRLYRAVVSRHWMLGEGRDERVPVSP